MQTIRMSRNMTQMQVVEKMQLLGSTISRSTYANIESGRRNIKASDLKALKEIFNVDYSEFFKD
ncbi:MAG: helix-turn-helix domain-containing protein [Ruminococcus sp.]